MVKSCIFRVKKLLRIEKGKWTVAGFKGGARHGKTASPPHPKRRRMRPLTFRQKLALTGCAVLAMLCVAVLLMGQDMMDAWQASQTSARLEGLYFTATPSATVTKGSAASSTPTATPTAAPTATASPAPSPTVEKDATPTPEPVPTPMPTVTLPAIHEDFQTLYEQNAHIVGWLRLGEDTDEPVVQYDNDYYLHHDYFGKSNNNGVLFLNANNKLYPRDDVWLIHGHNMASGAMFGKLRRYASYEYVQQYPLVMFRTVYDEAEVYYAPIAAFDASMAQSASGYFDITQMLFENDEEAAAREAAERGETPAPVSTPFAIEGETTRQSASYQQYLDDLREWSYWQSPVDVNVDDELLMLVTCSYLHTDGRFMLVCRKLRQDETPESMSALYMPEQTEGEVP